ncbi:hypothetical protein IJI94_03570 [Candidatus Saccharibacteria bacterium]|nr:hypothetical protein [Candidatus Saccharibacteria bacterium]
MVNKKSEAVINWDAKEYILREKHVGWYVGLTIITLALAALAIWIQEYTFLVLVVLCAVVLVIYSVRPPRELHYSISNKGISEGNKLYSFADFKAFGVLKEGKHFAIVLTPRKRFAPRQKIYFPEEKGEAIVDAFGYRLPMEEVKLDFLDKIVDFLRI